jgi:ribosome-associated heat shock protein Hsp15
MVDEKVRIDKWLWAARFFKTRSLASAAVTGGHVQVNGARVKAARVVAIGDELRIVKNEEEFVVIIQALSGKRGSATVAHTLYEETVESKAARETQGTERRLMNLGRSFPPPKRPGKRDRRLIRKFTKKADS